MKNHSLLVVDGIADLILGLALIAARGRAFHWIGVPRPSNFFYTNILGGVLVGIGVALLIQTYQRTPVPSGLGILGATWINICGAGVLAVWLLFGRLAIPTRGVVLLSCIAAIVLLIAVLELISVKRESADRDGGHCA